MNTTNPALPLAGKKGLITGIANDKSIAYAVAKAIVELGGEIAVTYQNDKTARYTQPLAEALGAKLFVKLDVAEPGCLEGVIAQCGETFGELDFAIHSMAFCNADDLHGRVIDATEEGFDAAMNVSCHSFLRMAKALEPLMAHGGSLITMSYLGAERVVRNYGVMGIIKAAHPEVLLDFNRCILCSLCVRASRDVDGKNVFALSGRGIKTHLIVNARSGQLGDTDFALADKAAQVCPVGVILRKRQGFAVPIGERKYDKAPIAETVTEGK